MEGTDRVQISLTLNEWNTVLLMLAKQPYELSADLIMSIRQQAIMAGNAIAQQQGANLAAAAARASNGIGPLEPIGPAGPIESYPFGQGRDD